ncbi:hypothetical protein HBH64_216270 [Parastagonospora nodorum]|nr:hypothetical protein HBI02_215860 [Parastagonospora nodorum]KAH4292254.1 hypothetical protein HBI01_184600 [Parastagonospora nodorum]KAH4323581.1 hypothetical protein HBI00_182330 [Parastagonospora nodorum]KAH4356711.1 hypothetical protein HBH94_227930 [Parastagonospora nodorum]KAH4445317.1 hypothetical protein HBH90_215840 [Parastagonospora nodorum]
MSIILPNHETYQHGDRRELPPFLWRTFYEGSYTPSCYVASNANEHIEAPSRYFKHVKGQVSKENAFQAREKFGFEKDLTEKRVSEHLVWRCCIHSSFVSAFDFRGSAEYRAQGQFYKQGRFKQERVAIAKISTADLSPATYRASPNMPRSHSRPRCGDVPIWIDLTKFSADMTTIKKADFEKHLPDVWLSMAEIRCHFGIFHQGQDDEWLACGSISLPRVTQVMPYDGQFFHEKAKMNVVSGDHVFNFQHRMWLPEMPRVHDFEVFKPAYERKCKFKNNSSELFFKKVRAMIDQDCDVSKAEIADLQAESREIRDVMLLLLTYYEKVLMDVDQHDELSSLVEKKRDEVMKWTLENLEWTHEIGSLVWKLSTLKSKGGEEIVIEDDLADSFGALAVDNDA